MIPIPAIDLKEGRVVRLTQGDFTRQTTYGDDPAAVARAFESAGAGRLHVVDLEGALKGEPRNEGSVEKIAAAVRVPIELGGGIRSLKTADRYFRMGVRWVVLGTKACLDEGFLREALREHAERIIVGIDARDGWVATDGWTRTTDRRASDFASRARDLGARTIIYTDISADGALVGPNVKAVEALAGSCALDVIASGGVGSLEDLRRLAGLKAANLIGVIIGKALYEKKFTLEEAVKTCLPNESFPV